MICPMVAFRVVNAWTIPKRWHLNSSIVNPRSLSLSPSLVLSLTHKDTLGVSLSVSLFLSLSLSSLWCCIVSAMPADSKTALERCVSREVGFGDRLVRSHVQRRCSILGPTQSRASPSVLWNEKREIGSGSSFWCKLGAIQSILLCFEKAQEYVAFLRVSSGTCFGFGPLGARCPSFFFSISLWPRVECSTRL